MIYFSDNSDISVILVIYFSDINDIFSVIFPLISFFLIAPSFSEVQKQVSDLLKGRILVGHAVQNDLKVKYDNNNIFYTSHKYSIYSTA